MNHVLLVLVGGFQNCDICEGVKVSLPRAWRRMPASKLPDRSPITEEDSTIKGIKDAVLEQLNKRTDEKTTKVTFLAVRYGERFSIGWFCRRSPKCLAREISNQIKGEYASLLNEIGSNPGDTISLVLLTFSAGALLARRAMLMGLENQSSECAVPLVELKTGETAHKVDHGPWPQAVKTLVILSGITKGWQFTTATPAPLRFLGQAVRFLIPLDLLIWKLYRGSPFVVDTRLEFAEVFSGEADKLRCDGSRCQLRRRCCRRPRRQRCCWRRRCQRSHRPRRCSARRRCRQSTLQQPRTIFFLGSRDEFVTPSDCLDLDPKVDDPIYLEIPHTTHIEMIKKAGEKDGPLPKLIAEAITPDIHENGKIEYSENWKTHAAELSDIDDYLDPLDLSDDHKADPDVEHVVIVMHGIRDDGFWTKRISREIKTLYRSLHPDDKIRRLRTVTPSYGFFSMWDFLFPGGRTRALYWFLDKYADIRRLYPRAKKIDLIAHSNGTYLGAQALRESEQVSFRRMIFAGSVVRRDFWMHKIDKLEKRLEAFYSFIGREDLIVALLPGAMETIPVLNCLLNVGGAGAFGFHQLPVLTSEHAEECRDPSWAQRLGFGPRQRDATGKGHRTASQRMIRGGHGAAIQEDCWKAIARLIILEEETSEGKISMDEILDRPEQHNPSQPLKRVSRGPAATLVLVVARVTVGVLIVPLLLFLLLFPLWYPFLLLKGLVPALSLPVIGSFPLMISALWYLVLFLLVVMVRNGLRYL